MMEIRSFNTASGMALLQPGKILVYQPMFQSFQYRKQYGPGATDSRLFGLALKRAQFQYHKRYGSVATVSIKYYQMVPLLKGGFQYRKRYGSVATHSQRID